MPCNFARLPESKMWCSLGRGGHEQVREKESRSATPAHASRAAPVARCAAGGGGTPSRCDAHDREHLERAARVWRPRGARTPTAGSAFSSGCAAEGRTGAAAQGRRAGAGICDRAVDAAPCRTADRGEVQPSIQREPSVADFDRPGVQQPAPDRSRARARRASDPTLEAGALAGSKKNPENNGESSSSSTSRD